jgi:hypothetical protein
LEGKGIKISLSIAMKWQLILIVFLPFLLVCGCQFNADRTEPIPESKPALNEVNQAVDSTVVIFPDDNLEAAVRNALYIEGIRQKDDELLGKSLNEAITRADLAKLTVIEAAGKDIMYLDGLEYCVNLKELYLPENQIGEIHSLSPLTNLDKLNLGANQISDIAPLASLTSLTVLDLYVNQISDVSPLSLLTNITNLYLFRNRISDISPLANLAELAELDLYANEITDISPLLNNNGLGKGDMVRLAGNNLDFREGSEDMNDIEMLRDKGVIVVTE